MWYDRIKKYLNKFVYKETNIIVWLNFGYGYYYKGNKKFHLNVYGLLEKNSTTQNMFILKTTRSLNAMDIKSFIKDQPRIFQVGGNGQWKVATYLSRKRFVYSGQFIKLIRNQYRLKTDKLDIPLEYVDKLSVNDDIPNGLKIREDEKMLAFWKEELERLTELSENENNSKIPTDVVYKYIEFAKSEIIKIEGHDF